MQTVKLYFATNRKHLGKDRWKPTGYDNVPSSEGAENLRFGELTVKVDSGKVDKCLSKKFKGGRIGDGEGLTVYLKNACEKASINAYEDPTVDTKKAIPFEQNSSVNMFRNIKGHMMKGCDALVYIHGYNVDWSEAVASALSLQFMLNSKADKDEKKVVVILFSWPSLGSMNPYSDYHSDRSSSRNSAKAIGRGILKLRDFLGTLKRDIVKGDDALCGSEIHLLSHSMGNYVLQKAVETKLIGYSNGQMPRIFRHIFMCAADIDDNLLEIGQSLERLQELGGNVTIYHNQNDKALYISKTTKNETERLGQCGSSRPALVHNKIHQVDCTSIVRGFTEHSYYLWATVNDDIRQSINCVEFDDAKRKRKRNGQNREWSLV